MVPFFFQQVLHLNLSILWFLEQQEQFRFQIYRVFAYAQILGNSEACLDLFSVLTLFSGPKFAPKTFER
jgi:hypothetical protein